MRSADVGRVSSICGSQSISLVLVSEQYTVSRETLAIGGSNKAVVVIVILRESQLAERTVFSWAHLSFLFNY